MTFVKSIHKTLRGAGYERRRSTFQVGPKIYTTYTDMTTGYVSVLVPGNWKISLLHQYQDELMEVLKAYNPSKSHGSSVYVRNV